MFQYLITMAATVIFDLTVAIIIGILFSVIMFVLKVSDMTVNVADVDPAKIDIADKDGKLGGTKGRICHRSALFRNIKQAVREAVTS